MPPVSKCTTIWTIASPQKPSNRKISGEPRCPLPMRSIPPPKYPQEQRLLTHPSLNKSTLCLNNYKVNTAYPLASNKA